MSILPLRAILFQILFLTIAIAIESFVLHKQLYLSQRTSIEYAVSLNLFSTICGWAIFFLANPLLPFGVQQQMVNFILFGKFAPHLEFSVIRLSFDLGAFILFTFLLIFCVERLGLEFSIELSKANIELQLKKEASGDADRQESIQKQPKSLNYNFKKSRSKIILLANAYSQGLILLISFILERL